MRRFEYKCVCVRAKGVSKERSPCVCDCVKEKRESNVCVNVCVCVNGCV